MTGRRNELKAGVFIIVTVVLAAMVIIWIRGANVGPSQNLIIAYKLTDDLGGLQVGDDVRLGGYKIGIVRDIHLEAKEGAEPRILVGITVPASYRLRRNAIVTIQNGLTGTTDLNIQSIGTGEIASDKIALAGQTDPKTALFAAIGRIAPHLENTLTQIDTVTVPKVNRAVDTANTLLAHANDRVDPIVDRYNKVVDSAHVAIGHVNGILGDTTPDIRGTLKNLNGATGTLKEKLPGLIEHLNATIAKVDTALASAQVALLDVQKTASNARDITGSLRSVIVDNQGKLDGIITGLKTTSDNLKEASIELRHSPWRLLYKPTPEEAGNLNVYDSAREFAQGAGSLSDAATALRDAMHDPNADRASLQKRIDDLNASFSRFQQVENKLWMTAKP
jgi:ABC-type transporter Mla subunit MlaD